MHLVPSYNANLFQNQLLFAYRIIAAVIAVLFALLVTVSNVVWWNFPQLQYLTIDGVYLTAATMVVLVISHFVF